MVIDFQTLLTSPGAAYAEGLNFFSGTGMLNDALSRLVRDLDRNEIEYAVIGAIALNQHGYRRFTEDIDLLMTREGLELFREKLVGLGYRPAFEGAKKEFRTTEENIPVEIITSGEFPGDGLPKSVVFPEPMAASELIDNVRTVSLPNLIELKLASGISAPDKLKDLADVQELIRLRTLGHELADKLDPYVRDKYAELVDSIRNAKRDE